MKIKIKEKIRKRWTYKREKRNKRTKWGNTM